MSSKIIGADSDFFSNLAVNAALQVKTEKDGKAKCPISNIHVLKSHGQSILDSQLVDGFALNCTRAAQGMPTIVKNAKVSIIISIFIIILVGIIIFVVIILVIICYYLLFNRLHYLILIYKNIKCKWVYKLL